jgi:hypothetical protein
MGQCVIVIDIFFCGTLHMWARIDEEHDYKEKMFTFQTWKKIIKHYPMTGRLIVTQGNIKLYHCTLFYILKGVQWIQTRNNWADYGQEE